MNPIELYTRIDRPLIPILYGMEQAGITLDLAVLDEARLVCEQQMEDRAEKLKAFGIKNPNSTQQVASLLYGDMKAPVLRRNKETRTPTTDAATLSLLEISEEASEDVRTVARLVIDYRQPATLIKMFIKPLPTYLADDGRLHPNILQCVVETSRLAMSKPNLMNIPHRTKLGQAIRRAIVAAPGKVLVKADQSQMELRIAAALSGDPVMSDAYISIPPKDIHTVSCQGIFGFVDAEHRTITKPFNFGTLYLATGETISRSILRDSGLYLPPSTAQEYIDAWWALYAGIKVWQDGEWAATLERGYKQNWYGRRDYLPDLTGLYRSQIEALHREGANFPIQSTGADYVKLWMIRAAPLLEAMGANMLLQVHDELVVECDPERADDVIDVLVTTGKGEINGIPLVAEPHVGTNWQDVG